MPRLMSVSLTEDQVRARTKTVTRRIGWRMLRPGDQLVLCRKVMGRRPGEPLERIVIVEVVSVRREPLAAITVDDVAAEGFPQMTPDQFVSFFCETHRGCAPDTEVTVIKWRYLDCRWLRSWLQSARKTDKKRPRSDAPGPFYLVAGAGFEPATSGL